MEKLLMLGTSLASKEIVEYAKSQGVYTIVTDRDEPDVSGAKLVSDEYWMISTADIDILEKKCIEESVTAVMCGVSEFNLEVSMELCKRLGLPHFCSPEAWHYSRDKADFKKLCKKIKAPIPEDYYISDDSKGFNAGKITYPVVVKPVDMSCNRGISYCYNEEELTKAIEYARSLSKNPKLIIERMLQGREWYSFYAIAHGEVRQIALNAMEAEPGQLKNLYSLSTTVTDNVEKFNSEVNPYVEKLLKEVGCKEGIAWVQEMLDKDGHFYIIEMGYRLPGDLPFMVYPEICGFDSIKWLTDYHRGINHDVISLPKKQMHSYRKCGCGYTLWANTSGILKEFDCFDKIEEMEGVSFYTLLHEGDHFQKHMPLGVICIYADTIDEFCEKLKSINNTISIKDQSGRDVVIRYTDFDYLHKIYNQGLLSSKEEL